MRKVLVVLFCLFFAQNIMSLAFVSIEEFYKNLPEELAKLELSECSVNKLEHSVDVAKFSLPALICFGIYWAYEKGDKKTCISLFENLKKLELNVCDVNQIAYMGPSGSEFTFPCLILSQFTNITVKDRFDQCFLKNYFDIFAKLNLDKCDVNKIACKYCLDSEYTLFTYIINQIAQCGDEEVRKDLVAMFKLLDLSKCDVNKIAYKDIRCGREYTLLTYITKQIAQCGNEGVRKDLVAMFKLFDLSKCDVNKIAYKGNGRKLTLCAFVRKKIDQCKNDEIKKNLIDFLYFFIPSLASELKSEMYDRICKKRLLYLGFCSMISNLAWSISNGDIKKKSSSEVAIKAVTSGGLSMLVSSILGKTYKKYYMEKALSFKFNYKKFIGNVGISSVAGCVLANVVIDGIKKYTKKVPKLKHGAKVYPRVKRYKKPLSKGLCV